MQTPWANTVGKHRGWFGCDALVKQQREGLPHQFVTVEVHDVTDADPIGNEPLRREGEMIGCGAALEIEILGECYSATVIADSPHDPENARLGA